MAEYLIQEETLTELADAIRSKTGSTASMTTSEMITEISNIEVGTQLPPSSGGGKMVSATFSGTSSGLLVKFQSTGKIELLWLMGDSVTTESLGGFFLVAEPTNAVTLTGSWYVETETPLTFSGIFEGMTLYIALEDGATLTIK